MSLAPASNTQWGLLRRLWRHLSPGRRRQAVLLLMLSLVASVAELATIGSLIPFLGVLTAPERVFAHPYAKDVIAALGIATPNGLLFPATVGFILFALAAAVVRVILSWAGNKYSLMVGADFSTEMFRRTLYQPYPEQIRRNSSEVIDGLLTKTDSVIGGVLTPLVTSAAAAVMITFVLSALLAYQPWLAISLFGGMGAIYFAVHWATRAGQRRASERAARCASQRVRTIQEGLGGIRDLLLDGTQPTYVRMFQSADVAMRQAQVRVIVTSTTPRYVIEALGIATIALLAYGVAQSSGDFGRAVPLLGAVALAAQRILPLAQMIYLSTSSMAGAYAQLGQVLDLLDQPIPEHLVEVPPKPLPFEREIRLRDIGFSYRSDRPQVLKGVSLTLPKGVRVGFVGTTGSGKSTLLDILMGLLPPTNGDLLIDGQRITDANRRAWQLHIAHVPQAIFLADASIAENIAFGQPADEIDLSRVKRAAQRAQIGETINGWPEGFSTRVGERGVQLSGGQRQRIGIARALYKNADVLVFDEATSALDRDTEEAVMQAIESLERDLTLLIIAHRTSTLRGCDAIYRIEPEGLFKEGSA